MNRFVVALLGALCLAGTASGQYRSTYGRHYSQGYYNQTVPSYQPAYQPPPVSRLDVKVDGSHAYNAGRSAEVPTSEASRPFLTLITSDHWQQNQRERDLVSWLTNNARLAKLRTTCRFNWYTGTNPHYRDQLRYKFGEALPIVCIQRPDGQAILNVTAISMPRSAGELADMCDDALNQQYAAPTARGGEPTSTQITEDCGPDCNPNTQPPHVDVNETPPIDAMPEVIPARPGNYTLLFVGVGAVVLIGFMVLVVGVLLMARGQPAATSRLF